MSSDPPRAITDADVRALAAKLTGLHALLTPSEQALLHADLRRAAARETPAPDTEGFVWAVSFNPFTYLDAIALARRESESAVAPEPRTGASERGRERPAKHQKGEIPVDVMQTLEAKAQALADTLSPAEWALLEAMPADEDAAELSPELRAKVEQFADGLTPEELARLHLLLDELGVEDAAAVAGYAVALYEGDAGNKGRPQPGTPANAAGRDPASVVSGTGHNLYTLLCLIRPSLPF
jgi:hypothetical protein